MRTLVAIFMMLLLPLQGWMGSAMATQMATQMAIHAAAEMHHVDQRQGHQAAPASVVAIQLVAMNAHGTGASNHFDVKKAENHPKTIPQSQPGQPIGHDCAGAITHLDVSPAPVQQASQAPDHSADCGSCPSCQACHTFALAHVAVTATSPLIPATQGFATPVPFASADAALSQKPPIF